MRTDRLRHPRIIGSAEKAAKKKEVTTESNGWSRVDGSSEEESLERKTHDGIEEQKLEEDGEERHHVDELM